MGKHAFRVYFNSIFAVWHCESRVFVSEHISENSRYMLYVAFYNIYMHIKGHLSWNKFPAFTIKRFEIQLSLSLWAYEESYMLTRIIKNWFKYIP